MFDSLDNTTRWIPWTWTSLATILLPRDQPPRSWYIQNAYKMVGAEEQDDDETFFDSHPRREDWRPDLLRGGAFLVVAMSGLVLLLLWCIHGLLTSSGASPSSVGIFPITPVIQLPWSVQQSLAMYSPYFPAEKYKRPPARCKITQVNLIQRHGARFPTVGASTRIRSAVQKLQNATSFQDPRLAFLGNYTYDLGVADLVPFGAAQSYDSGQYEFVRYKDILGSDAPFVRASSSTRVVDSATNWTAGFAHANGGASSPSLNLILQESLNDTLDDSMCPNSGDSGEKTDIWRAIYAGPIAERLNNAAPGANLSAADATSIISLCAFDTIAKEKPSPFCDLFYWTDFAGFEYYGDLDKYYGTGYGQDLGPVQGVGYINELIARLTNSSVRDNTQTNRTLDSNPSTFPLGRTFYADFSHDNQMIAIFSAMGLFRQNSDLDPTQPGLWRSWIVSRIVPFSGRLVTERLECDGEMYVRMLVNDALQDLEFCGADADGLCTLDAFVASQGYATSDGGGDFERCFTQKTI